MKHINVAQFTNQGISHGLSILHARIKKKRISNPVLRRSNGVIKNR